MKKQIIYLLILVISSFNLRADEGMWPLTMLQQLQDPMTARGLKLTAEQIYSINNSSIKDAIVRLQQKGSNRMFCTGEIISKEGLFLTNHHCGYGAIQELSTDKDNILKNGFWAMDRSQERAANLNIGLLRKIEDITDKVLEGINVDDPEKERTDKVNKKQADLKKTLLEAMGDQKGDYLVEIISFYGGNRYMAMYYEVFTDIRLVGTPPESMGKFGGETDNWRWPRHTADFSMFRIYSNKDNNPATFNNENRPYAPKHHLPVNISGFEEGDFSMILGYPGNTTRYTHSEGIKYLSTVDRPFRVQLRRDIMDVYESYMKPDPKIRLQYSDKLASIGNYWNKYGGEARDLKEGPLFGERKKEETDFMTWANANGYGSQATESMTLFTEAYGKLSTYGLINTYFQDGLANSQPMMLALGMIGMETMLTDSSKTKEIAEFKKSSLKDLNETFKEYYAPIEKKVLAVVLRHMVEDLNKTVLPQKFVDGAAKFKNDYNAWADYLWSKSVFTSKKKYKKFIKKMSVDKLKNDPLYDLVKAYYEKANIELRPVFMDVNTKMARATRLFQNGMLKMSEGKLLPPDANRSMRLTYGRISGYNDYKDYTLGSDIVSKYKKGDFEFDAPVKLIEMLKNKDFGQYADKRDGQLHVCFLSDNDITGGNSGSPVINGNGELIGTAFDGNWEAISSDFMFMPKVQRTISLDVRYTLWIIDKFSGAGHLINEMTIIK